MNQKTRKKLRKEKRNYAIEYLKRFSGEDIPRY
jgi:DNA-dependent RNA polymerase auxiliary subunit epsilon